MEIHSKVWRGVCFGVVGALLWFGLASPKPFRGDPKPFRGGLPACRRALDACQGKLGSCQSTLGSCRSGLRSLDSSLDTCQSNLGKVKASLGSCQSDLGKTEASLGSCQSDLGTVDAGLDTCQSDLGTCQSDLGTVDAGLDTCQSDLGEVDASLGLCQSDLGTCQSDLGEVDASLGLCQSDLGTCQSDLGKTEEALEVCQAQAPRFPATGQVDCWNSFADLIPCAGTGHDGNIRAGAPLSYTDNGDGTVTDINTSLIWENLCDEDPDPGGETCPEAHDVDTRYNWVEAFGKIAMLNTEPCFATYCDWRLPNVKELLSIVNYQNVNPAVSPAFNNNCIPSCAVTDCSCTALSVYWSSTSYVQVPIRAWGVNFIQGEAGPFDKTFSRQRVRAVRGP